jgi:predicted rRNA methylase
MSKVSPHTPQAFFVEGLAAVAEYVKFKPRALVEIRAKKDKRQEVERLLKEHQLGVPLRELGPGEQKDEGAAPVVAKVNLKAMPLEAFEKRLAGRTKDLIVAVDHITDPRNLGAVVRSAAFFGVREVIAPERRQVLFTQAAVNTAQGGFALCDLVTVVNLSRALEDLKEKGYWIVGTAMDGEPLTEIAGTYEKVVLVLGSEESGLSQKVRGLCDRLASIPARGDTLESLNVSVAAGIFLYAFR